MKVWLVVQQGNKEARISLGHREVRALYDVFYLVDECKQCQHLFELNHIDKALESVFPKLEHAVHNLIDEGRVFGWDAKTKKSYAIKRPHYVGKLRPRWKTLKKRT